MKQVHPNVELSSGNPHRDQVTASGNLESQELIEPIDTSSNAAAGFIAAMIAGVAGGLILFPMKFAPQELQGLSYLLSMSIGVLIATPLCLLMQWLCPMGLSGRPQFNIAAGPGLLSGLIWNFGNACSIVATQYVRC